MAKNGKMIILRGNSDPKGEKNIRTNLESPLAGQSERCTQAAEDYARKRDYEPVTLPLEGQQSRYKGSKFKSF